MGNLNIDKILYDMELLLILLGVVMVLEFCRELFLFFLRRGRKEERKKKKKVNIVKGNF